MILGAGTLYIPTASSLAFLANFLDSKQFSRGRSENIFFQFGRRHSLFRPFSLACPILHALLDLRNGLNLRKGGVEIVDSSPVMVVRTLERPGMLELNLTFQNQAPNWYRTPIRGPALGRHMRKPGCNGAVCYCNSRDFCNENDATRVESKAASHPMSSALLLLTLFVCSVLHGLG